MRDALNKTGRKIFYSMEGQAYFPDVGNMVRTGGDIWPKWDECVLRNLYANNAQASLFTPGKGFFNDVSVGPARASSPAAPSASSPRPPAPYPLPPTPARHAAGHWDRGRHHAHL